MNTIPKSGFEFLKKLKKNNNRDWFLENKHLYEVQLKIPLQEVIIDLGKLLSKKANDIQFDPKKSIFRMNRDIRFSENKSPYKTYIGASFSNYSLKKEEEQPGLYLHIEPGNCFIGGGLYKPSSLQIRKIRELIIKDSEGFKKIINATSVKKHFNGLTGEKLKRAPKGISEDHPLIELLKWKQFVFIKKYNDTDFQKEHLAKNLHKEFLAMIPLIDWLNKAMKVW